MPQYIRIVVIALLSAVLPTQALAQRNPDQKRNPEQGNGLSSVIQKALVGGISIELNNKSTNEATASNSSDESGGSCDDSAYLGLTSVAINGKGGPLARGRQCQIEYGSEARICGIPDLLETKAITCAADDRSKLTNPDGYIERAVWIVESSRNSPKYDTCIDEASYEYGSAYDTRGYETRNRCMKEIPVACCR